MQNAVEDWKSKNIFIPNELPSDYKLTGGVVKSKTTELFAQNWDDLILENFAVITSEQKKTADAQRKLAKLKDQQANLII